MNWNGVGWLRGAVAAAILILAGAGAAAQELIVNGGFETNSCAGPPGQCKIAPPWVLSGSVDVTSGIGNGGGNGSPWALNPFSSSTTSQLVSLATSGSYRFSFFYASADPASAGLTVTVGGQTVFNQTIPGNTSYQQSLSTLVLAAGNVSVVFTSGSSGYELDIDDVSLTLIPSALTPSLPSNAPSNVKNVAGAIDNFLASGGTLPAGFQNLFNLSGQSLVDALSQLSGEVGASGGVQAANQMTNSFLTMLLNGFTAGRGAVGGFGAASGYAPAPVMSAEAASAYASINKAAPYRADSGWTTWGSAFGGQSNARGDAAVGSNDTRATTWGLAAGFDKRVSPSDVVGVAFGGGSTNWNLANGMGRGRGEVFQTGAYASHQIGAGYVSAAATYALHSMTTDRTVFLAGTDKLTADFTAHNVGGRVEAGWRFLAPGGAVGVTPYAAAQVQAVFLPGFSESATTGSNQFALTFNSRTATDTRTELGFWFDTRALTGGGAVNLFSRLAWAHDWRSDPSVTAAFQSLGGSSFVVGGATPPDDVGLVTAGIEAKVTKAITVSAKFDGEFGSGYQSYAGTGTVKYRW
jgi:uncharacterized protein with beta-barrel porin domain